MAISNAVTLANFTSGDAFTIDSANDRVGVANTLPTSSLTVTGDAKITGVVTASSFIGDNINVTGVITAASFVGDGSNLDGVVSGIELQNNGSSVGTAVTNLNFVGFSSISAPNSGLSTITAARSLTVGTRVGAAMTFSLTSNTFSVANRLGGSTQINVDA